MAHFENREAKWPDGALINPLGHWTDSELYVALEHPEEQEPGPKRDAEIQSYLVELKRRYDEQEKRAICEQRLRERYRL